MEFSLQHHKLSPNTLSSFRFVQNDIAQYTGLGQYKIVLAETEVMSKACFVQAVKVQDLTEIFYEHFKFELMAESFMSILSLNLLVLKHLLRQGQ